MAVSEKIQLRTIDIETFLVKQLYFLNEEKQFYA